MIQINEVRMAYLQYRFRQLFQRQFISFTGMLTFLHHKQLDVANEDMNEERLALLREVQLWIEEDRQTSKAGEDVVGHPLDGGGGHEETQAIAVSSASEIDHGDSEAVVTTAPQFYAALIDIIQKLDAARDLGQEFNFISFNQLLIHMSELEHFSGMNDFAAFKGYVIAHDFLQTPAPASDASSSTESQEEFSKELKAILADITKLSETEQLSADATSAELRRVAEATIQACLARSNKLIIEQTFAGEVEALFTKIAESLGNATRLKTNLTAVDLRSFYYALVALNALVISAEKQASLAKPASVNAALGPMYQGLAEKNFPAKRIYALVLEARRQGVDPGTVLVEDDSSPLTLGACYNYQALLSHLHVESSLAASLPLGGISADYTAFASGGVGASSSTASVAQQGSDNTAQDTIIEKLEDLIRLQAIKKRFHDHLFYLLDRLSMLQKMCDDKVATDTLYVSTENPTGLVSQALGLNMQDILRGVFPKPAAEDESVISEDGEDVDYNAVSAVGGHDDGAVSMAAQSGGGDEGETSASVVVSDPIAELISHVQNYATYLGPLVRLSNADLSRLLTLSQQEEETCQQLSRDLSQHGDDYQALEQALNPQEPSEERPNTYWQIEALAKKCRLTAQEIGLIPGFRTIRDDLILLDERNGYFITQAYENTNDPVSDFMVFIESHNLLASLAARLKPVGQVSSSSEAQSASLSPVSEVDFAAKSIVDRVTKILFATTTRYQCYSDEECRAKFSESPEVYQATYVTTAKAIMAGIYKCASITTQDCECWAKMLDELEADFAVEIQMLHREGPQVMSFTFSPPPGQAPKSMASSRAAGSASSSRATGDAGMSALLQSQKSAIYHKMQSEEDEAQLDTLLMPAWAELCPTIQVKYHIANRKFFISSTDAQFAAFSNAFLPLLQAQASHDDFAPKVGVNARGSIVIDYSAHWDATHEVGFGQEECQRHLMSLLWGMMARAHGAAPDEHAATMAEENQNFCAYLESLHAVTAVAQLQ